MAVAESPAVSLAEPVAEPIAPPPPPPDNSVQIGQLTERLDALEAELAAERAKRRDIEKEQEDLLVLLEELSAKRRNDKVRMKEKGLEVSEGEDEGEDDDEDEDDEDEEGGRASD